MGNRSALGGNSAPRRLGAAAIASTAAFSMLLLGACGGSGKATKATVPKVTLPPAQIPNYPKQPNGDKNVKITKCAPNGNGGWMAQGTITNPTGQLATDTITILFTVNGKTVNYGQEQLYIEPNSTRQWEVTRQYQADPNTQCTVGGVGNTPPAAPVTS